MINITLPDLKPLFDAFSKFGSALQNVAKSLVKHVKPLTLKIDGLPLLWQNMTASEMLAAEIMEELPSDLCGLNRHDRRKVCTLSRRALRRVYGR